MPLLTILAAVASVMLVAIAALLIGAMQGAGRELGRAGLAESAPWIASVLPRLGLRILRIGRAGTDDLEAELDSLVEQEFKGRRSVAGRTRALLTVLKESVGILRRAREIRGAPPAAATDTVRSSVRYSGLLRRELARYRDLGIEVDLESFVQSLQRFDERRLRDIITKYQADLDRTVVGREMLFLSEQHLSGKGPYRGRG